VPVCLFPPPGHKLATGWLVVGQPLMNPQTKLSKTPVEVYLLVRHRQINPLVASGRAEMLHGVHYRRVAAARVWITDVTVRALMEVIRSETGSLSFCGIQGLYLFCLGSRPAFLPSRPYFRLCVLVAVFLSTETSL
jgi:hypothetical protein